MRFARRCFRRARTSLLATVRLRNGQAIGGFVKSRSGFDLAMYDLEGRFHSVREGALLGKDESVSVFAQFEGKDIETGSGRELARFDSGWVERFARMNQKHGYWGMAYLKRSYAVPIACSREGSKKVSEIQLTGLQAGTPIGFLAALGAFRHAAEMREQLGDVRLGWSILYSSRMKGASGREKRESRGPPSIGWSRNLTLRWSCSTILFKY